MLTGPLIVAGAQSPLRLPSQTRDPPDTLTGPDTVVPHSTTLLAPDAASGPRTSDPDRYSPAPGRTVIGPLIVASYRHVRPDETVSGPLCVPVIVFAQAGMPDAVNGTTQVCSARL